MEKHISNNLVLPPEILKNLFGYLTDKKDITHSCQLVCKSWYFSTLEYVENDIKIMLYHDKIEALLQDIQEFPLLASKIKNITLPFRFSCTEDAIPTFGSLINLCPNLSELLFASAMIFDYLMRDFNSQEISLLNIQIISIRNIERTSLSIKNLHLGINFRFRDTITHLDIFDLEHTGELQHYDKLMDVVSDFLHLKYLKAKFQTKNTETIDLESLMDRNKELQELKLYKINRITLNSLSTITAPNSTLTKLKLEIASEISINVFQYIMDKFENLKNLRLIVHTVLPDDALGASGNKSVLNIFFNQYCRKLDRLNVSFMYRQSTYTY